MARKGAARRARRRATRRGELVSSALRSETLVRLRAAFVDGNFARAQLFEFPPERDGEQEVLQIVSVLRRFHRGRSDIEHILNVWEDGHATYEVRANRVLVRIPAFCLPPLATEVRAIFDEVERWLGAVDAERDDNAADRRLLQHVCDLWTGSRRLDVS